MPTHPWPNDLNPPHQYTRCARCGIDVSPSPTWGRRCRDCDSFVRTDHSHGTPAGYARHARAQEQPCDPCREAMNAHRRAKRKVAA